MDSERWHDPSGRGCAIAGMVARGDTPMTGDACKACLEDIASETVGIDPQQVLIYRVGGLSYDQAMALAASMGPVLA